MPEGDSLESNGKYATKEFAWKQNYGRLWGFKWEPDPISTPSATIQNAVLNQKRQCIKVFKSKDGGNGFRSNQNKALVVS